MSDERPKRRRRRKDQQEPTESAPAETGREEADEARSAEEGPVAPQAGVDEERSDEARSADEGPVAPQAGVDEADEAAAAAEPAPRRRRGSAETGGARRRAPRRGADGELIVRAQARYVRTAPRKARLVVDHIRGKRVDEARAILRHTPRHAARDVLKLLESCVSNAENNHELVADELVVHQAYVDEGPTIRRYRPRAYGRATRINKRTSHMTVTLTPRTSKE